MGIACKFKNLDRGLLLLRANKICLKLYCFEADFIANGVKSA